MPIDHPVHRRAAVALTAVVALLASMLTIGLAPAHAANQGTLKVYQTEPSCEQNANDPQIYSPYWLGGFDFVPDAEFSIEISTQPGGQVVQTLTGTIDPDGTFCAGPVTTEPGRYKAEMTGPAGEKSKVYGVVDAPPVEVTPAAPPAPTPPTCDADGVLNPPTDQEGVIWTVTPADQTGPGEYTITAAPAPGYTFPDGTKTTWPITVEAQLTEGCTTPPTDPIEAVAAAPGFSDPTCEDPTARVESTDTAAYTYSLVGTVAPGSTVTVIATAADGYVLTGTDRWEYTFPTLDSLDCEVVDEVEDEEVAGAEDELARTGANVGPAGLALLLMTAGAALVTARRVALR